MTNKEKYREYLEQLRPIYNANEAAVITDWVFESLTGLHRADIIRNPEQIIEPGKSAQLDDCLDALLQYKPVQYILGEAWFYKMKLTVNEQVLIPRPETEELVQLVVDHYQSEKGAVESLLSNPEPGKSKTPEAASQISMLDIGTGSGCIAIAVKKSLPGTMMTAIDVSAGALWVAKENAVNQKVNIHFLALDFLDETSWKELPVFDTIISNPPYIPLNEKDHLGRNVTAFEPHTALFVPDHSPLLFYEKIAAFGKEHLAENGRIYVEIHEDFAKETAEIFTANYCQVEIIKDIFGKERMIAAEKV